ncbi:unnamed protein product, partial [Staurois parvus]
MEDTEWRDWQRGVEDTEWSPGEGLAERGGGQGRDWQRGVEDTDWRPVEGLAERGGRHRTVSKVDESGSSGLGGNANAG